MSRHPDFVPQGVIPAVLLPFHDDFSIDEPSFRAHLRDVAAVQGLSAITINAHSTEVASCTRDEQARVMEIASEEVGDKLPIIHGVWADGSLEAARIARQAQAGGASALLVFPPAPFTLGQSAEMALAHFKTISDATDLPLIVFQYPLATGQGYPAATLERLFDEVPAIRAIKDWTPDGAATREPNSRLAGARASHQRAVHQQRVAFELAGARLQWPAFRQRQRHRRPSGQALSRREGQRSCGSPPAE